jgi:hypothetical protein
MSFVRVSALAALLLALATSSQAEEDTISTDRPDFVESSSVVGKGRWQIETGFAIERDRSDDIQAHATTTPTLLRFGVGDTWELRVETDGYANVKTEDRGTGTTERIHGMTDVSVGAKWHMQDGDEAWSPAVAWLLHADLDTGAKALRGDGVRPSLRMVAEWDLPLDWSLGVMPGVMFDKNEFGQRYTAAIAAITVGKGWTDRFRTFVELAGQQLTSERNGGSQITYDAGATYLITNDVQIDTSVSVGANRHTPDFQWGVGLSVRF